jgi:hypothetical protein
MGVFTISAFTNEQTLLSAQVESPQQYYDFSSVSKHLRHRLDRIISLSDEHASDLLWIGEGVSHVIWRENKYQFQVVCIPPRLLPDSFPPTNEAGIFDIVLEASSNLTPHVVAVP